MTDYGFRTVTGNDLSMLTGWLSQLQVSRWWPDAGGQIGPADAAQTGGHVIPGDHGGGKTFTTRKAAAAAVGAGQGFRYQFDIGIFFHPEQAGSDRQHNGGGGSYSQKREDRSYYHGSILTVSFL